MEIGLIQFQGGERRRATDALAAGDTYVLSPTYTDTLGDHVPNVLTVDWGDSSESIYEAGGQPQSPLTHVYATAGTYVPSLSLTAFKDDGHIAATVAAVDVIEPTVGIIATNDTASEHGQQPGSFEVTRTGTDFDVPLTVSYSVGGTLESSAYVVTDQNGQILDGSVTIPAGASDAPINVYPLEDQTPRWTDTVDITLSSGGTHYAVNSAAPAAGCYVVSDDLYAWLDNGSDNQVVQGDDGDVTNATMVPLVLDLPENSHDGDVISLDYSVPTEANVWMHQTPGTGEQPVLGMVDGAPVSEVTWTVGTDDDAPYGMTTLWVEPTGGSANLNDIYFNLSDSDAGATKPSLPQYPPPSPPSPPPPAPVTSNSTNTNGLAGDTIILNFITPAQNNGNTVIVGQEIGLTVTLEDPKDAKAVFPPDTQFTWSVPGRSVGGYTETVAQGFTSPTPTTTSLPGIDFYWLDAGDTGNANQGVNRTVSVTAAGISGSINFMVESPVASVTAVVGTVQVGNKVGGVATRGNVSLKAPNGGIGAGITFNRAASSIPQGFGGDWDWLQVESSTYTVTGNNGTVYTDADSSWALDATGKAAPGGNPINDPWHYTAENQPGTGDSPYEAGNSAVIARIGFDFNADMYLMFKPNLPNSIEVPIRVVPWYAGGTATWNAAANGGNGAWVQLTGYAPAAVSDQLTHSPPQWSRFNKHPWNPALPAGAF